MALPNAVPKPEPRFVQKAKARVAAVKARVACCRKVDAREDHRCRVCRKRVRTDGLDLVLAAEHHELVPRSQGGDPTDTNTVVLLCKRCHMAEHHAEIRLSGNADEVYGVRLERVAESGWVHERWI